jgi:ubiquinone/menaquinone biosynthesis C-methylase UbiE
LTRDSSAVYESVSLIYGELMRDVKYKKWSEYLLDVVNEYIVKKNPSLLELAAGDCKIAGSISNKYHNIIASDISLPMLQQGKKVLISKVCCDMTSLPFNNKFELVYSTFDSVNYLLSKRKLLTLFLEVKKVLSASGIFTFDVSLEKNSLDFEGSYTIKGNVNGYSFKRKSKYNISSRIHKNIFSITDEQGNVKKEIHKQKIYKFETYFDIIAKAGLYVVECLDAFTFNNGNRNSERVQFVLKKNNTNAKF